MAVTFTRTTQTRNETTGAVTQSTSTITGSAIQVRGDPQRYASLGLTESGAPTLFFSPTNYDLQAFTDEFVLPGDVVEWNSVAFTAKDVTVIAPDGIVIASRIICGP